MVRLRSPPPGGMLRRQRNCMIRAWDEARARRTCGGKWAFAKTIAGVRVAHRQYWSATLPSTPCRGSNFAVVRADVLLRAADFRTTTKSMAQNSIWDPSDITNTGSNEGESPKRRGRIPQSAWPQILERHRAGATLTAIAREFDCTPSAISYIVRKAEAAGVQAETQPAPAGEPAPAPQAQPEAAAPADTPAPAAAAPAPAAAPASAAAAAPAPAAAPAAPAAPRPARTTLRVPEPRPAPPAPEPPAQAAAPAQPQPEPQAPASGAAPASPGARSSEPVDAVEARLRDTARACLLAYRSWRQQPGEASIQTLSDSVHELRKALARIEIDISATRRDEQAQRPIPIPAHRAARRPPGR